MNYNLTGMNFYKSQNRPKQLLSNIIQNNNNDLRSSSAFDQKRFHNSPNKRNTIDDHVNKIFNFMPKQLKKVNIANLDIV